MAFACQSDGASFLFFAWLIFQPTFAGGCREPGRPAWHYAEHMTCWSDGAGVIYVAIVREPDCVRLVAGARPHPVEREAITLLPPSS